MGNTRSQSWAIVETAMKEHARRNRYQSGIRALARQSSCPASVLSDWKNGNTVPDDKTALKVANAIGISPLKLLLQVFRERLQRDGIEVPELMDSSLFAFSGEIGDESDGNQEESLDEKLDKIIQILSQMEERIRKIEKKED